MPSLATQYEILKNVCGNVGDFHGLILNGSDEHDNVEYVLPQFQRMAERVVLFLWDELILENSSVIKLAHLLMKIFPIELEVMNVCFTNLKASNSAEVGCFINKLLEASPDILREYLIHLQEHMDLIHHEKLFDLLARLGALIREVSTLVHNLEEKSRNEESTDETLDLLEEKIELLKEDLKHVYLKDPDSYQCCFPMNDGPLFMHLLLIHLNDLLDFNSYSIALIKDVAYEAKDVIDSIIIRDNGLLHLIFSLPKTTKKIRLIKEDVSNLREKIPMNKSFIVVNSAKNPVERKSLTTGKIIVGFKEETNWLIRKLTSGPANLDVISITVKGSDLKFSEDIDVADMLRKQLFGKRYLIVLDDVWDTTTWDDLTRTLPEVKKGSRIILTTRQKEVAFHGKGNTDPLNLRLLSPEESWELIEKRAFGDQSFPDELLEVGKEIAQNCMGLPLVADLIAGVIAEREKTKSVWLEVRNNLNSFILNSEVDVMKVVELIYDHLPHHLKPCFLHLARCPKDTALERDVLKVFWHAEGLVEQTEMMSVEEVMEIYLDNLISSSLVNAFHKIGDYPSCQLHDLVHDFCLIKAKEEKLFGTISSSDLSSPSDLMLHTVVIDYDKEHFEHNNFVLFNSKIKRHSGKYLYSLAIAGDKMADRLSNACHVRDLRLLRVLILNPSFMRVKDSLLNEIGMLNHLRFLRIGTEVKSLPSSFSNLRNLETLWVDNKGSTLVLLPSIWDLVKLRMLFVDACYFFDMDSDEPRFIRFPNLQALRFVLKESWNYSTERYWFPKLDLLTELDNLSADFESSNANDSGPSVATNWSWDFHFPSNLKTLTLSDFPLASYSLSTIARLPNLELLSLIRTIIQGEEWNMGEGDTLANLKYLGLFEVTLAKWDFGEESFPVLEKLLLLGCRKLTEIPPNFGDIGSLKVIQLVESPQLEDSTLEIKQYVEDITGKDRLQILGPNDIPLSKTVHLLVSAMPCTVTFLPPNTGDFSSGTFKSIKRIGLMGLTNRSSFPSLLSSCYSCFLICCEATDDIEKLVRNAIP
ncbi:putative lysine-specific demethylase JMJ14-like [Capsicum annuum]|nr:putative lysine-specific demethylase JMJ14-like [Capsicum annuum]